MTDKLTIIDQNCFLVILLDLHQFLKILKITLLKYTCFKIKQTTFYYHFYYNPQMLTQTIHTFTTTTISVSLKTFTPRLAQLWKFFQSIILHESTAFNNRNLLVAAVAHEGQCTEYISVFTHPWRWVKWHGECKPENWKYYKHGL